MATNQSGSEIRVGAADGAVFIQVHGKGTHMNCQPLRECMHEMLRCGYSHFEMDLGNCSYMDSTFLGVLVGISQRLKALGNGRFTITRVNQRNMELMTTLGIDRFFHIQSNRDESASGEPINLRPLPEASPSLQSKAETMLDAHETLAAISKQNALQFKDVIQFLKEDLAQIRKGKNGPPASSDKSGE